MTTIEGDFTFTIKERLGIIKAYATGWKKEFNIVEWNGGNAKFDIRDWDPEHEHMSRGITLREEEVKTLAELINRYFQESQKEESIDCSYQEPSIEPKDKSTDQTMGNF